MPIEEIIADVKKAADLLNSGWRPKARRVSYNMIPGEMTQNDWREVSKQKTKNWKERHGL